MGSLINSIWSIVVTAMMIGSMGFLVETTHILGKKALDAHQEGGLISLPELNKMLFEEKGPRPSSKISPRRKTDRQNKQALPGERKIRITKFIANKSPRQDSPSASGSLYESIEIT